MKRVHTEKDCKFKYGNYNRYYGYRNENTDVDKRIFLLQKDWFEGKSCLDIGCNVGHITLYIAKFFEPKQIKGVDIDFNLIKAARANILHYIDNKNSESRKVQKSNEPNESNQKNSKINQIENESLIINGEQLNCCCFEKKDEQLLQLHEDVTKCKHDKNSSSNCIHNGNGNVQAEHLKREKKFPYNVTFITENFVPSSENLLKYTKEEYDIIICLSVTKWVQLNSGDEGLKLMFHKIFKLLNPGGKFLLEPQPYKSYKRRKNLSTEIRNNYDNIKLKPEDYINFLMSEVGFTSFTQLDTLKHDKQGFERPVYLLTKASTVL